MKTPDTSEAEVPFLETCRRAGGEASMAIHHPVEWGMAYAKAAWLAVGHSLDAGVVAKGAMEIQAAAARSAPTAPREWSRKKRPKPLTPPRALSQRKPSIERIPSTASSISRRTDLTATEVDFLDHCIAHVKERGWRDRSRKPCGRNRANYVNLFPGAATVRADVRADGLRHIANSYAMACRRRIDCAPPD